MMRTVSIDLSLAAPPLASMFFATISSAVGVPCACAPRAETPAGRPIKSANAAALKVNNTRRMGPPARFYCNVPMQTGRCAGGVLGAANRPTPRRHSRPLHTPSYGEAIDDQQDDRAQDGHQPSGGLVGPVETHGATDESAKERPRDTQQDRDDEPARITARHQELGDDADHQTEQNPRQDTHRAPPCWRVACNQLTRLRLPAELRSGRTSVSCVGGVLAAARAAGSRA